MRGMNINGEGFISGAKFVEDKKAFIEETRKRYKKTPVIDMDKVPNGKQMHIGEGIWLKRCPECDIFELIYGGLSFVYTLDMHTYKAHKVDVVGINVAMLSK